MVEISMKRNKGFSLVELLVSLLVVSIALLGFAALQTFSARTIRTAELKNVGNEVTQSFVKYLQMSQDTVRSINWGNGNVVAIPFSCDPAADIDDNLVAPLVNALLDLCSPVANNAVAGIQGGELELMFERRVPNGLPVDYAFYAVEIRYAYRPLRINEAPDNAQVVANNQLINRYCPFGQALAVNNNNRLRDNVVCDIVEVRL
jgi:prepilin-type N-terminal cleavage/methylation domain-containing protein